MASRSSSNIRGLASAAYAAECRRRDVEPASPTSPYPPWLGVPMVAGEVRVGALVLRSRARPFTDHDERMLREVATIVAIALRDTELFKALAAARDVLAAIAGTRDGLVATDLQGRIIHFSPGARGHHRSLGGGGAWTHGGAGLRRGAGQLGIVQRRGGRQG